MPPKYYILQNYEKDIKPYYFKFSILLGSLGIIFFFIWWAIYSLHLSSDTYNSFLDIAKIILIILLISSVFGFIFGVLDYFHFKKNRSWIGISISLVSLIITIFYFVILMIGFGS